MLGDKSDKRIMIEGSNSFANGEQWIVAGETSKEVNDVIFFKPFLVTPNV